MSRKFDRQVQGRGTRFRIFPQPRILEDFREPETVWVSPPPGRIGAGPNDGRMHVVDALDKRYYDGPAMPPWRGPAAPPLPPGPDGHFDQLEIGSRGFMAAHMYGTLRRILDIWEDEFGQPIQWHFRLHYPSLELIPQIAWDNAQAGYGFIETGFDTSNPEAPEPYCLNFDVLAHEFGHMMIFSKVGIPLPTAMTLEYRGFQEAGADLVALVSVLHFNTFMDHLLRRTAGNLYALNELNRIGELSNTRQIRLASNALRLSDVIDVAAPPDRVSSREIHELGEPLTGAIFDVFVGMFQQSLLEKGLIDDQLDRLSGRPSDLPRDDAAAQAGFDAAYEGRHAAFKESLEEARDLLAERLAGMLGHLQPDHLRFTEVAEAFLTADRRLSGWKYQDMIRESFQWRQIGRGMRVRGRPPRGEV